MATSSKVQFKLEKLREEAIQSLEDRIEAAQKAVNEFDDDSMIAAQIRLWREEQEARISDLFRRLGGEEEMSDHELAQFKVHPIPGRPDPYERNNAVRDLRRLESLRSRVVAKANSLVADDEGNISLTKTQLEEFFGL